MSRRKEECITIETKVVILGHEGVGKTSMVNRYIRGQFTGNTTATIGACFMRKEVQLGDVKLIMQIWDTAGQERFRSMAPMYYRGAHAAILVYDVTAGETFDRVESWVEELQAHASDNLVMVLAGNKCDLKNPAGDDNQVSLTKAQAYAKSIDATVFETSAKADKGVSELFDHVARCLVKAEVSKRQAASPTPNGSTVRVTNVPNQQDKKGGCC